MQRSFAVLRGCYRAALQARAATQTFTRSLAAKASGLEGITVTKGSAAVKQAVAQQRWIVGDADSFKKCDPCEQGGKPLDRPSALALLQQTPSWTLSDDGVSISRTWQAKVRAYPRCLCAQVGVSHHTHFQDFKSASAFLQRVAVVAENEGHHPDLHLVSYNNVTVRLTTYALGGLSYNDFIMALKIDSFPAQFLP